VVKRVLCIHKALGSIPGREEGGRKEERKNERERERKREREREKGWKRKQKKKVVGALFKTRLLTRCGGTHLKSQHLGDRCRRIMSLRSAWVTK
jgi:hypothetical protein